MPCYELSNWPSYITSMASNVYYQYDFLPVGSRYHWFYNDWVLGDDSKQYRCYKDKIVIIQNIIRDRIPHSRFSYAYTLGL